ncbi:MAG: zinc-ribbon domain-containing protein [Labilithrix sp.]
MDVSCPACAAKYTCDEEKLRGKTARMRCKACNTAWMVSGPGASSAPKGSMPPPSMPPPSMIPASSEGTDKRAAVMKTGAEREKRDLFAQSHVADEGSIKVKDTLLPPPSFGFTTGSRSENSVLFRVDQLSDVGGRIKTPEPIAAQNVAKASDTPRGGDEEGVIDLKALASVPPGKRSVIPVAPLFSEPPPMTVDAGGTTGSRPAIAKPISKGKLFGAIAAAAVFLVIAGAGISVAFKGEEPVHHAAAVTPAPAPTPVVSAAPAPTTEPAPATSTASNDETDGKKGKKGKKGGKKAGGNASASNQSKAPVKPADPCGCKGDFNCILACTAKNGK